MPFAPPAGVAFETEGPVRGEDLVAAVRRVASFLEGSIWTPNRLRLFDDLWERDGRHLEKASVTYAQLFAMLATGGTMLDATPEDDRVYVGVAPERAEWYLRFRSGRHETHGDITGAFGVVMPDYAATLFRLEVGPRCEAPLIEAPSKTYYARLKA